MKIKITDISLISTLLIFFIGYITTDFNIMIISSFALFVNNIIFSLMEKRKIIFLIFNCTFFLFLIGRPIIALFKGYIWWSIGTSTASMIFAVTSIYFSLIFLYIGARVGSIQFTCAALKADFSDIHSKQQVLICNIQLITEIIFYLSLICFFIEGYQVILFMKTHTYVQYYTDYVINQPAIIKAMIQLMTPSMCVFLATFPSKKKTFFVLLSYMATTIIWLIVGMRSPIVLASIFALIYYIIRDIYKKPCEKKWFGKKEFIIVYLTIPILITFLFSYMWIRQGKTVDSAQAETPIISFIYQQGNSFYVLAKGYNLISELPDVGFPGYFFGPAYDNISQNLIVRLFSDKKSLPGQSLEKISSSHDLRQHLSYLDNKGAYLLGNGIGTSYILDTYIPYGWIGLIIYNFFLGFIQIKMIVWIKKNWLFMSIILYILLKLFYIPRSNAIECFIFLISPYFWIGILIYYIGGLLISPRTFRGNSKLFVPEQLQKNKVPYKNKRSI